MNVDLMEYLSGLDDDLDLVEETMACIESIFSDKTIDEILHHSRIEVLAYICLTNLRDRGISLRVEDVKPCSYVGRTID